MSCFESRLSDATPVSECVKPRAKRLLCGLILFQIAFKLELSKRFE